MKLNPLKCDFGVSLGKFFGFMVNQWGIEVNPKKIQALLDKKSPTKPKEVWSLTKKGRCLEHIHILSHGQLLAIL